MKRIVVLLMIFVLSLAGCSKNAGEVDPTKDLTLEWSNGVISYNGKAMNVTAHHGYKVDIESGMGGLNYTLTLDSAKDVTNITVNQQGILEENMDKSGDRFFYTEFLGSKYTMAEEVGPDIWKVLQAATKGNNTNLMTTYANEIMDTVPMTNAQLYCDFGDFTFGNSMDQVTVRGDGAVITGVAMVKVGTKNTTSTVTCKGGKKGKKTFTLGFFSDGSYDYYTYGEYLITVACGLDINQYIKFD